MIFLLKMLEYLISPYFVLFFALLQKFFLFGVDFSESLSCLFFVLLNVLKTLLSIQNFFSSKVDFDRLNFFVDSFFIMLTPGLNLLFKKLLCCLLYFLLLVFEVFVNQTSVEIIKDSELDSTDCLHSVSKSLLLLIEQKVNWFAIGTWHLSQERKAATIEKDQKYSKYIDVLFII